MNYHGMKKSQKRGSKTGEASYPAKMQEDYQIPKYWPSGITFLPCSSQPSEALPPELTLQLCVAPRSSHPAHPFSIRKCGWTEVRPITSSTPFKPAYQEASEQAAFHHPALGQHGLFAKKDIPPRTMVVSYLGNVHLANQTDEDPHSCYDAAITVNEARLGIDATRTGSEARCECTMRITSPYYVA